MSFKKLEIYPPNPSTTRGTSTKLSSSKDKVIYASGRTVILRDLKNPALSTVYSGHIKNATVARISPSGYYCASADVTGKVNIWDVVGEDQILKAEYSVLSGRINDLSWDGESKRIIAVGEGRQKFGAAFMIDTGTSTGEIGGHSKVINAVSIRHQRPFKAATAGDDGQIIFHSGPPYNHEKTIRTHTKFVQDVRYSPSGDHFMSVGSDSKIFIYDGKTGDTVAEVSDSPHTGSIMATSWSPDSKSFFTSSADKTVKLWDAQTQKAVTAWTVGAAIDHQQVGNAWNGENNLVSLSLSGHLNIFDPRIGDKPARILQAPQKSINVITLATNTFLAGTTSGRVYSYSESEKESKLVEGPTHSNYVSGLASNDKEVYSIGFDDRIREISSDGSGFLPATAPTSAQPKSIAIAGDSTVFVVEIGTIEAFRSNQKVFQQNPPYQPSSVSASGNLIAIGGGDRKVRLNEWDGKTLKEVAVLEGDQGEICALSFSPDGKYLASGDSSGKIMIFDVQEKKLSCKWAHHAGRINSLSWTADSAHLASGSLDTHVYVWSVAKVMKNIAIRNAGPGGINGVLWLDGGKGPTGRLASTGFDGVVRVWEVKFHV